MYVNQRRALPSTADARTAVALPGPAANAVLAEMRTMLGSLHDVLGALSNGDTAAVRAAAERSGLAMAVDPGLESVLPEEFAQAGMRTLAGFDTLALNASAPRDTVLARIGTITAQCVSCHAAYRIERR